MAKGKTNAMRILDAAKIAYEMMSYDVKDGKIDGLSVAKKVGKNRLVVYKTLVAHGTSRNMYVFVIPVENELDLKKAATVVGEKKIEMIAVKDLQKLTGYIRGGCSPIGMSKKYPTFIQEEATHYEKIVVSGGKIGIQIELPAASLAQITEATFANLVKG